jgi:hypothetical protein|tara:strand:+ start:2263 stop:2454 length:192 start_codon:yes stop_codon:yes gene_type:complete
MVYKLINKLTKEVIDSVQLKNIDGKEYYLERKQLNEKDFDKLFEVKSEAYEWWQEESTTLDDF